MIQTSVIIWTAISAFICFALPIAGFIIMQVKKQKITRPFLVGALAFFISQIVIRIPILTMVLPYMMWFIKLSMNSWLYGLFLGLTAGLFEEGARLIFIKLLCKRNRRYVDGIAFGLGHGGIEAIILVGVNLISMLVYFIAINSGTFDSLMARLDPAYVTAIYDQCIGLTAFDAALTGIERIMAVGAHIGMTVIILTGIKKNRSFLYLIIAILVHTALDAPILILPKVFGVGTLGVEIYIALFTAGLIIYTIKAKKKFSDIDQTLSEDKGQEEHSIEEA